MVPDTCVEKQGSIWIAGHMEMRVTQLPWQPFPIFCSMRNYSRDSTTGKNMQHKSNLYFKNIFIPYLMASCHRQFHNCFCPERWHNCDFGSWHTFMYIQANLWIANRAFGDMNFLSTIQKLSHKYCDSQCSST